MYQKSAAQAYNQVNQQSQVGEANPHKLIHMLMQGALDKIHLAKGHMQNGSVEQKGVNISIAISIIDGLQSSLDFDKGGDIARNLFDLYGFMMEKLVYANLHNDVAILDEVLTVMTTVKEGWEQIPVEQRFKPMDGDSA